MGKESKDYMEKKMSKWKKQGAEEDDEENVDFEDKNVI